MRALVKCLALSAVVCLLAETPLSAAILKQMNLEELAVNADRIFSGTVIEVDKGTIEVGGGHLATVTYRILVDTAFRGEFLEKNERKVADIRMVADLGTVTNGDLIR